MIERRLPIQWLNDLLGWNPEGAQVAKIMQKKSMSIDERAARRKKGKAAKLARKVNRCYR